MLTFSILIITLPNIVVIGRITHDLSRWEFKYFKLPIQFLIALLTISTIYFGVDGEIEYAKQFGMFQFPFGIFWTFYLYEKFDNYFVDLSEGEGFLKRLDEYILRWIFGIGSIIVGMINIIFH